MNTLQHILIEAERMLADVLRVVRRPAPLAIRPAQAWLDRQRECPLSDRGYGHSYGELTGGFAPKPRNPQGFTASTRPSA